MPHYKKLFPSNYLRAADLEGYGDVTVTIREVRVDEVHSPDTNEKENKPVLYFTKGTKGLILNVTNAETIAQLYGDDTDGWQDKRIALYVLPGVKEFGKTWKAIRLRDQVPSDKNGAQPDQAAILADESERITHGADQAMQPDPEAVAHQTTQLYGDEPETADVAGEPVDTQTGEVLEESAGDQATVAPEVPTMGRNDLLQAISDKEQELQFKGKARNDARHKYLGDLDVTKAEDVALNVYHQHLLKLEQGQLQLAGTA